MVVWEPKVSVLLCIKFFVLIWVQGFFMYKNGFITMVAAASYYFDSNKNKEGSGSVWLGIKWSNTKHIGSLALGALIHAIITIIREIADQAAEGSGGGAVGLMIKCCVMCLV